MDWYPERKTRLFYWFDKKGVERLAGVKLVEITDKGLSLITKEGETAADGGRNVIRALPFSPNKAAGRGPQGQGRRDLRHR